MAVPIAFMQASDSVKEVMPAIIRTAPRRFGDTLYARRASSRAGRTPERAAEERLTAAGTGVGDKSLDHLATPRRAAERVNAPPPDHATLGAVGRR